MSPAWRSLAEACSRARDSGRAIDFWWRDDDATRPAAALSRLLRLAEQTRVPVALAVIPDLADTSLFESLNPLASVLQHGCDHMNRAEAGAKKNEFPASEPVGAALRRLTASRERLAALTNDRALGILVPPWNRIQAALVRHLPKAGFSGLSRFGVRTDPAQIPGLRQLDAHVDIIDWQGSRGFAGEEAALGQAVRALAAIHARCGSEEPQALGWLTHHACHDSASWEFLERLFETSRSWPGVRWIAAGEGVMAGAR